MLELYRISSFFAIGHLDNVRKYNTKSPKCPIGNLQPTEYTKSDLKKTLPIQRGVKERK